MTTIAPIWSDKADAPEIQDKTREDNWNKQMNDEEIMVEIQQSSERIAP